jgi:hypothetical protein
MLMPLVVLMHTMMMTIKNGNDESDGGCVKNKKKIKYCFCHFI